jgi:hypothetical protein
MSKFITSDPPYNPSEYPTNAGFLELAGGVALSSTLTNVTDQLNRASTLYLSTQQVSIGSGINNYPLALRNVEGFNAIFDTSNITVEDKTFIFPDASLTFAGINNSQNFSGNNTFSGGNIFNGSNNFTTTQNFNVPDGTSGTSNISIPTVPYSGGGRNANHPTLVLGSVTGSIWGLSGNGTYLGINAPTVFIGNLIDLKLNGTTVLNITQTGALTSTAPGALNSYANLLNGLWLGGASSITNVTYSSGTVTYTTPNIFKVGQNVTITGVTNSLAITNTSGSNGAVVYSCANTSGLYAGQTITISGSSVAGLNTTQVINLVSTNSSFRTTVAVNPTGATTATCTYTGLDNQYNLTGNVASASATNFTVTATLSALGGTYSTGGSVLLNGATSTSVKPMWLLEQNGTTSTNWSTFGTGIGLNAPNGFSGNLIDLKLNNANRFSVSSNGVILQTVPSGVTGYVFEIQVNGVSRFNVTGSNGIIGGTTIGTTNSIITNFKDPGFNTDWATIGITSPYKVTFGTPWRHTALPTSRPSTVGDIYVDTAANILASGDKILAIRV